MHELLYEGEYEDYMYLDAVILRDDGKMTNPVRLLNTDDEKLNWFFALNLEPGAEQITRIREEWLYLHFKLAGDDKLQFCASHCRHDDEDDEEEQEEHTAYNLNEALALVEWR